jgi:hypothetical protein
VPEITHPRSHSLHPDDHRGGRFFSHSISPISLYTSSYHHRPPQSAPAPSSRDHLGARLHRAKPTRSKAIAAGFARPKRKRVRLFPEYRSLFPSRVRGAVASVAAPLAYLPPIALRRKSKRGQRIANHLPRATASGLCPWDSSAVRLQAVFGCPHLTPLHAIDQYGPSLASDYARPERTGCTRPGGQCGARTGSVLLHVADPGLAVPSMFAFAVTPP